MITSLFTISNGIYVTILYRDTNRDIPSFEIRVIDMTNSVEEI